MPDPLLQVALDLCAHLAAADRYRRLTHAARRLIPCDAIALLRLEGEDLIPVVVDGLREEVLARRFAPAEHPRLAQILATTGPIRFTDTNLPDPFDGLFAADSHALAHPHACMGCRLVVDGEVTGVLTVDALAPAAFDGIDDEDVAMLAALAGAAIGTAALIDAVERAAARDQLVATHLIRDALQRGGSELLGNSAAMARVREEIALVARSDLSALVTGETGVGKELVARAIHAQSRRRDRAFIHVNCAALPESIAESELFGHVRGAFTGAVDHRAGKFEISDGGTLVLDEIGELPLSIQPKLLRALQSGEVQRVGADRMLQVDVRVIAATNRDLAAEVQAGRFRGDLFHRLSVFPIHVPPLRERRDDIALLSGYFLDVARSRLGVGQLRLTPEARARLHDHDWPGNVRELEHTLLRGALRASGGQSRGTIVIDAADLGLDARARAPGASPTQLRQAVDDFTRQLVSRTLAESGGNWSEAARRLGVKRGNLHRLAARLGLHARA